MMKKSVLFKTNSLTRDAIIGKTLRVAIHILWQSLTNIRNVLENSRWFHLIEQFFFGCEGEIWFNAAAVDSGFSAIRRSAEVMWPRKSSSVLGVTLTVRTSWRLQLCPWDHSPDNLWQTITLWSCWASSMALDTCPLVENHSRLARFRSRHSTILLPSVC